VLTFGGLAGVGDLVATCASPKSRNRTVGFELGQGRSLDEIVSGMHMVAEGVKSAGPLVGLARSHGVEMPIAEQVEAIVEGRCSPRDALMALMDRPSRPEWDEACCGGRRDERPFRVDGPTGPSGDGPDEERRAALAHVREILHLHGATDEEIDQALADDVLDLFVFDRVLVPSRKRYTRREVAELTGVNHETLERFWRALGFPNVSDDERSFTDLDLEAVRLFQGMQALGPPAPTPRCRWPASSARPCRASPRPSWCPGTCSAPTTTRSWRPTRSPVWPTSPFPPWPGCSSSCGEGRWRRGSDGP
jgi:hypothetical protein